MFSIIKILKAYNFLSIYLALIILFNLLLLNLPLTNIFGFESSALNSVLLFFLSGIYTIILLKKKITKDEKNYQSKKCLKIAFLTFLIIPFLISIINSLVSINCSFIDGLFFYLILTVPSFIIGGSLGIISFVSGRKVPLITFFIISLLILAIPLIEFYLNPQIYFYNPIFGYFPGTIYDEGIKPDFKLIFYRALNLIFFGIFFILFYKYYFNGIKLSKKFLFTFLILIPILFIYFSPVFGFSTTIERMKDELSGTVITPNFIIHYPFEIDSTFIKSLALYHEYYYSDLEKFFNENPDEKIISFIFLNSNQKKKLLGSANADIAKPWLKQIYTVQYNYLHTLKHEIAHVFSGEFGTGILKAADGLNPSLIEGIAMAADPDYDENNLDYIAALAYKNNYNVNMDELYEYLNFFTRTSSLSYVYAGSFTKYLVDNYGIEKFKLLYQDLDFSKIYGASLKSILDKYYIYLQNIETDSDSAKADYYFGRESIFYKVCPRYVASELKNGWQLFNDGKFKEAKEIFEELLTITNDYSALIGLAESLSELNKKNEAINLLKNSIKEFKHTSYYYNIDFKLADLLAEEYNNNSADSIYKKLINLKPNRTLFYLAHLRDDLLKKDTLINNYLSGNNIDKYMILKKLNKERYNFYSFPVLIDISKNIDEDYNIFLNQFNKTIYITDYAGSYAMYKLSLYMIENLDFDKGRKMAALSLRYDANENFKSVLRTNFNRTNWLFYNSADLLTEFRFN